MKFAFISNMIHHHQKPFCDEMYRLHGDSFCLITTMPLTDMLRSMGYSDAEENPPPYWIPAYRSQDDESQARLLLEESDVVLYGAVELDWIRSRLRKKRLTFIYAERLFKNGICTLLNPRALRATFLNHMRFRFDKHIHMLCASAYASYDFARIFSYPGRCYRWGYFISPTIKTWEQLEKKKEEETPMILWAGRMLDWKHPELAVLAAQKLCKMNFKFRLRMIGGGPEYAAVEKMISDMHLDSVVKIMPPLRNDVLMEEMEKAKIFLFTSDFQEGWGAVLNEAMSRGCAVIASHAIGAAPWLVDSGKNGLIFHNLSVDDLVDKVKDLLSHPEKIGRLGKEAYNSINQQWNPHVAATRLSDFARKMLENPNCCPQYEAGPCSIAPALPNNWHKTV